MEAVQALVSQMRDEEHQLLAGRRSRSERAYETAISTSLLSSLIGLTLIAALVWLLQRSLIGHQRARRSSTNSGSGFAPLLRQSAMP
jgi:hypothetical protein